MKRVDVTGVVMLGGGVVCLLFKVDKYNPTNIQKPFQLLYPDNAWYLVFCKHTLITCDIFSSNQREFFRFRFIFIEP